MVNTKKDVFEFIKHFSSEEIKPYNLTKIITYNDYLNRYKDIHIKLSEFYGDLTPEIYKQNIEKKKALTNQENKEKMHQKDLLSGFLTFDLRKDLEILDKLIIKEYRDKTYFGDIKNNFMNSKINSYEIVSYFMARIIYYLNKYSNPTYSLHEYAKDYINYYSLNQTEVFKGMKLPYSSLLSYEKAKGKVILLSTFTPTTEEVKLANFISGRNVNKSLYKLKKRFSVILIIKNNFKSNWISNSISSKLKNVEKEIIYLPFSFFLVKDVQIDYNNYKADIYLETIGKLEILEEQIKKGKEIKYNQKENIMEVK